MATDFSSDIKDANDAVRDFGKNLSKISKEYRKSIGDIVNQSKSLPKNWSDVSKKLSENLSLTGRLTKNIGDLEKKLQAGKVKQASYVAEIAKNAEKRRGIEVSIGKIEQEQESIRKNSIAALLGVVTPSEQARIDLLESQKNELKGASGQLLNQQKTLGQNIKSEKEKNKELENSVNVYTSILLVLNLTKQAVVGLIKLGETYDKVVMGFAHSLGVGRIEAEKYVPALTRSAQKAKALGASLIDSTAAATQLVNQFELMATSALEEVNHQMLVLNKAFGVSLEDGAKFYSTLTQVGNASLSSQTNMTGVADAAAKAAGVPLGRVIKDVANISDGVRLIFRGNTEQLIKQAAEARKLGTNLDSAAKSAEALLNFESSVANELKLSALLGKNVNFNESRRLFFAGKTVEAEKAILSELNRIGDINDLNYLQRKALFDLTGKSFGELQKMQAQSKQQLELDSKFPEYAAERLKYEEKLKQISGDELKQKQQAEEMQKRDNIANARANVFLKQKEQILINLSRAIQPFYRALTNVSEAVLDVIIKITDWMAEFSNAYPIISGIGTAVGIVVVGVVGLAAAIGVLILTMSGLAALGIEISAFLTEVSIGLAAFGVAGLTAVPVILSIAAAIAAIGVAAYGLGTLFEGIGSLIRSILEPIVKFIEVIVAGFNAFISNIGTSILSVAAGLKSITDIGFVKLAKSAAGVSAMATAISSLGFALISFPTDKLTGFAKDFAIIANANATSLNKLSELFETASVTGGKLMIGIEEQAVASINKLSDLKGERDELKQTILETNDKLVKSIETLTSMMANGGIGINLDGQRLNAALSKTNYRSGGFGQSTTLA
jgi:hypothetical protein